jgi:acetyl-CoA carboxylase biotin carboxyl carrier protein
MATDELLALIDRLEAVLAGSELDELEVEVGETSLRLRRLSATSPSAVATIAAPGAVSPEGQESETSGAPGHHQVLAPLTGIFYGSPSPDAAPYVQVGAEIQAGQVIGLIEAMKLFNEIKSDVRGRVVRLVAENGQLIKARQPLIEVAPG